MHIAYHIDGFLNNLAQFGRAGKVLCPIDVVGDTEPLKVQVPGVKITPFSYPFVFIKWFAKESRVSSVFDWRITAQVGTHTVATPIPECAAQLRHLQHCL